MIQSSISCSTRLSQLSIAQGDEGQNDLSADTQQVTLSWGYGWIYKSPSDPSPILRVMVRGANGLGQPQREEHGGAGADIPTREPWDLGVRELRQRQNVTQPGSTALHPVSGPTHSVTGVGVGVEFLNPLNPPLSC